MRFALGVVVAVLSGCQGAAGPQGPAGPAGARGEPGPQGERGPAGATVTADAGRRLVSVDAMGREVETLFVDGVVWPVNQETGAAQPLASLRVFFDQASCAGPGYVQALSLSYPVEIEGSFRVRDNVTRAEDRRMVSSRYPDAGCLGQTLQTIASVPLSTMRVVTPPTSPYVGPIHLEVR